MAEETDTPIRSLADQRDELKRELQALIFCEDVPSSLDDVIEYVPGLSMLDRAKAIRDLTEAFVRLGGDIELGTLLPAQLGRIELDADKLALTVWKVANERGVSTEGADLMADVVRAAVPIYQAER